MRTGHTLRPFISHLLMFKTDWLMTLCGTDYRFDDYKRMKQNNGGKCLFLITH